MCRLRDRRTCICIRIWQRYIIKMLCYANILLQFTFRYRYKSRAVFTELCTNATDCLGKHGFHKQKGLKGSINYIFFINQSN